MAEYVEPQEDIPIPNLPSQQVWYSKHVREIQYFLQIPKGSKENCCKPARSGLKQVLADGFLPPPYPLKQTSTKVEVLQPGVDTQICFGDLLCRIDIKPEHPGFTSMPYDCFCPSVACISLQKNLKIHKQSIHGSSVSLSERVKLF